MQTNQIKKGDTLPCGGVVSFVSSTGYYLTPKGGGSRQWVATQVAHPAGVIDYAAVQREQAAAEAAREAFANRDMTKENAAADKAKQQSAIELARMLALAGVASHEELMGSVPWAAQYLPYEQNGELAIYNNTGETRGVWDHAAKSWVWKDQNNRGNRDDAGSGYAANTHGTE
jgi:antirestriction protein ArdC